MTTKKLFSHIALVSCALTIGASTVRADSYGTYGGSSTPTDLTINKQVQNPVSGAFVDNLGSTDPNFSPGSTVTFHLIVTNSSGETFDPVTVTDKLPDFLTFVGSSIQGTTYDANSKTITMTLPKMIAGESRTVELTVKVADRAAFPSDKSQFCVTNYSKATAPSRPNGDEDTAELCLATSVAGAQILPVAGFEDLATAIPFAALGGIGVVMVGMGTVLKRKTK
jgi:uncharacterized repeat protein (TIGR01451 family)